MQKIKHEIFIKCTVEEAFQIISDLRNDSLWWKQVVSADKVTDGEITVGTQFRQDSKVLFLTVHSDVVVRAMDFPHFVQIENDSPQLNYIAKYTIEETDDGCTLVFEAEFTTHGILGFILPLTLKTLNRQVTSNFVNLKRLLEAKSVARNPISFSD